MEVDGGRRARRGWRALLVIPALAGAYVGAAAGASHATADAAAQAAKLTAQGSFALAISLDNAIARRTGPLYVFDRSDPGAAPLNGQRAMLAWAQLLEQQGRVDEALAVASGVTDPHLHAAVAAARATILLDAARGAAHRGDYATALQRLAQLEQLAPGSAVQQQISQLTPQYQVGEAAVLTAAGRGADAVALLDQAAQQGASSTADAQYPAALLMAAKEELSTQSNREAAATLERLTAKYGGSAEAAEAQGLLGADQAVTGTLVTQSGQPISGRVRLSSHFFNVPGGYYTTGPFFTADADSTGTFRFDSVAVGGPYYLEIFRNGNWTTYIDPATNLPADPVTVAPLEPVNLTFIALP